MKKFSILFHLFFLSAFFGFSQNKTNVQCWLSSDDGKNNLSQKEDLIVGAASKLDSATIVLDPFKTFQKMEGFGSTFMDTDVYGLMLLNPANQEAALKSLFDPKDGMGLNMIRVGFGASDWERDTNYYSYDDMPKGAKDFELKNFSIKNEKETQKINLIKRAMKINPEIKVFASVWAIPAWMKTNDNLVHDYFDAKYTEVYAKYLVKSIQAFEKEGIFIYAISPQNEPGTCNDRDTPATCVSWEQERDMIKAMKKEFTANRIKTEIWILDHNFNMALNYAKPILDDPESKTAVDAVAFHDYEGDPSSMGELHKLYPGVPLIVSERNLTGIKQIERIVKYFHNWSGGFVSWNAISDEHGGPHQYGGGSKKLNPKPCSNPGCGQHYLNYNSADPNKTWAKTPNYFKVAQFSKFIKKGAQRIESKYGSTSSITTVSFKNPDSSIATIVVNQTDKDQQFKIQIGKQQVTGSIPSKSIATYVW